jgi:UDP-N-acetylmuramate--alanine ligase
MVGRWTGRNLHFIGVGGCGMSGLAIAAHALGATVTGSDRADGRFLARLRHRGIRVTVGHAAGNVPEAAEIVYSNAVPPDNPERERGRELGLHERRRGGLLVEVAAARRCIAVSGTHGKTTTAAMTVHALRGGGRRADYVIGADLLATGTNAEVGEGEWLVIETDESDRSLLALSPEVSILTNAELEHVRTFPSRLEVERVFREFLSRSGRAVIWNRRELLKLRDGPAVAFDALDVTLSRDGCRFRWRGLDVALRVPGEHNAHNAAAALEAAVLAGADAAGAVAALGDFPGTSRRFEAVGSTAAGATVYDDYAHHPTAVRATLTAARTLEPRRLIAVLQPFSHARTRVMVREFGRALALADQAVVLEVIGGSGADGPPVSGLRIAEATAEAAGGKPVAWMPDVDSAERYLQHVLRPGDLCVAMSGGTTSQLAHRLVV